MSKFNILTPLLTLVAVVGLGTFAATAPDNSKINERVQANSELTAQDQGNSSSDIELTRKIRQAVNSRDTFSTNAKNIKIISVNGLVTLKGPVKSAQEKSEVERIATRVAGHSRVISQIEIERQ